MREKLERYTKEGLSQLMTLLDLSTPKGAKKVWHPHPPVVSDVRNVLHL